MTVTYETIRQPRKMTAAEAAERLGVTPRTIRRYQAETREDFLSRAAERQRIAHELHTLGMTWQEVGEKMNCTAAAARQMGHRWRTTNGIKPEKNNRFAMVHLQDLLNQEPTQTSAERFRFTLQSLPEEIPVSFTITRQQFAAVLMALEYTARKLDTIDSANLSHVLAKIHKATQDAPKTARKHPKKLAAAHG